MGILNYGLRSSHAELLLRTLTHQGLGFLPFLVKHVELTGHSQPHVYNFLEYFMEIQKPPELQVCLARALCDGYSTYCYTYTLTDPQKYVLSPIFFLPSILQSLLIINEVSRAYVASLQMLLLSYLETISDEVTPVGQQVAELMNPLAPSFFKFAASKEYHELTLTLLKVVSIINSFFLHRCF